MLAENVRKEIAEEIYRCFNEKTQIPLLNTTYPDIEVEDAYNIQEYVVSAFQANGRKIKGYKVGLTSKAMQDTYLLPAICGLPVTPLVRVAANQSDQIGKVLDAGAQGVIVPMVNTADDARRAVAACRYPPLGARSCGPMRDVMIEGMNYLATANDQVACLLMIETDEGLRNVEAIASVEGVDGLFVDPMDLSYGLGLEPGNFADPLFTDAIARILAVCKQQKCASGIFGYTAEMAAQSLENGFDFASIGTDISFLRSGAAQALAIAKGEEAAEQRGGY